MSKSSIFNQHEEMFWCVYFVKLIFLASLILNYPFLIAYEFGEPVLNGRYTRNIDSYSLLVPHKITADGEFLSFSLPHYYSHDFSQRRRRRSNGDPDLVHYRLNVGGNRFHAEIWPNHGLVAPKAVQEHRDPEIPIHKRRIRAVATEKMCHYTGKIRGYEGSKVALSTCDGLAGYIQVAGQRYYIEPVEEHSPNVHGQHLHLVYQRDTHAGDAQTRCGTKGWRESWKRRFKERLVAGLPLNITKRDYSSQHRYLETLIVCDKRFLEHYKHKDYETYVLTIMNMVSDFYHDHTSGNLMDVTVVRILFLEKEEEEIDLVINQNADETLASFCKWQQKVNPKDLKNPNHHDIAVLLTRHDICAENVTECGLQGLAYMTSACTGNEPCAINEDSGLVLGITVAHEMGHVMGCDHDVEEDSGCPSQDPKDGSYYVMAPYVNIFTTKWSNCSRSYITALFDNDLGECLNDEPEVSLYKFTGMLPGSVYDADAQCDLIYPGSTHCDLQESFCEALFCTDLEQPDSCLGNQEPPADGTKCGENKWCYRKQCIEIGERPMAINGGWGEWGEYSPCSRTCGGGVSVSERDCNNPVPENKGRYCVGERKQLKICNTQPCPVGSPSYRHVQCESHNNEPFNDKLYTWREYYMKDEPCVLYCLNNENVFAKVEPRAKDGTPCKAGEKDMCIGGSCTKIGCDYQLNSNAIEDVCGICKGDGTKCTLVDNVYNDPPGNNYQKVVTVPSGSRNIEFEELAPSVNTLAVGSSDEKEFYLNGANSEAMDGEVKIGNTEGLYTHREPGKEHLIIHGPIDKTIILYVVFYKGENVGYRYKYAEPSADSARNMPSYHWELLDWTDCDARCNGGEQTSKFACVEDTAGRVTDSFCNDLEKPEAVIKKCNEHPCKTRWRIGKWSKCHACRFKSGVRVREIECVRESPHAGEEEILLEDDECDGSKPGSRELCNSKEECRTRNVRDELPLLMMESIWRQTEPYMRRLARNVFGTFNNTFQEQSCKNQNSENHGEKDTGKHHSNDNSPEPVTIKLKKGQKIKDRIPASKMKLLEVPIKQNHLGVNLTDFGFETMGDQLGDTLDMSKGKVYQGTAAIKKLHRLEDKADDEEKPRHKGKHKFHANKKN